MTACFYVLLYFPLWFHCKSLCVRFSITSATYLNFTYWLLLLIITVLHCRHLRAQCMIKYDLGHMLNLQTCLVIGCWSCRHLKHWTNSGSSSSIASKTVLCWRCGCCGTLPHWCSRLCPNFIPSIWALGFLQSGSLDCPIPQIPLTVHPVGSTLYCGVVWMYPI